PHWRGDLLLALSGLAYGSYSLLGRDVLLRRGPLDVTARSMTWGALAVAPLAAAEWLAGSRPAMTAGSVIGALSLGLVITAGGYLFLNWRLGGVRAPPAGVSIPGE